MKFHVDGGISVCLNMPMTTIEAARQLGISKSTVVDLLDKMGIGAEVSAFWGEKDEGSRIRPLHIDVTGSNLSILIGRRGETLSSLHATQM